MIQKHGPSRRRRSPRFAAPFPFSAPAFGARIPPRREPQRVEPVDQVGTFRTRRRDWPLRVWKPALRTSNIYAAPISVVVPPFIAWLALGILGLLSLAGLSAAAEAGAVAVRRPNVVVIIADDLGFADVGVHGGKEIPTPHIDSIATGGVRFSAGYVTGTYCSPTRAALLTGRYQQRFGHEFNPPGPGPGPGSTNRVASSGSGSNAVAAGLSLREVTLADRLKAAGYSTGLIGKWHLGVAEPFNPVNRGFDEFFGLLGAAHSYTNLSTNGPNAIRRGLQAVEEKEYLTDAFTREALSFIERHQAKPFYLQLAYNAVHSPLEPHPKYVERFAHIADERRRAFASLYTAFDEGVGAVLKKLRAAGLEEDTIVFFFSDNGGPTGDNTSRNEPLRGFKFHTYEGGVHVPFFVRWKGHLPAGVIEDRPVIQLDIHATALAAAGIEVKPEWKLDGVNLLPFLTGRATGLPHEALYWRFGGQLAIRKGDWKLVKSESVEPRIGPGGGGGLTNAFDFNVKPETAGAELYNLTTDPFERRNLAASEPAKWRELAEAWKRWNAELVEPSWRPGRLGGRLEAEGSRRSVAGNASPP